MGCLDCLYGQWWREYLLDRGWTNRDAHLFEHYWMLIWEQVLLPVRFLQHFSSCTLCDTICISADLHHVLPENSLGLTRDCTREQIAAVIPISILLVAVMGIFFGQTVDSPIEVRSC
eukprot:3171750-Rhodomonas_salina.2